MPEQKIVVIGGSAGSIEALIAVVGALPASFPAAVFAVVHVPAEGAGRLPAILTRSGPLLAAHAQHGERIECGRIYVAPPDRHMIVQAGKIFLNRGPRENHSRPAIDPLFRTAARAYGPETIGVILSGALYDGANGLLALKTHGGLAIVQDPDEAITPSMPLNALSLVQADYILPADEIGPRLVELVMERPHPKEDQTVDGEERINQIIEQTFAEQAANQRRGETAVYTCPDCGGVLWQTEDGAAFHCHVGHAYASEALLVQKSEELETALWACVRLLREKGTLARQAAVRSLAAGNAALAARLEEQAEVDEQHSRAVLNLLDASSVVDGPQTGGNTLAANTAVA